MNTQVSLYNAIGTRSSPATLTAAFSGNTSGAFLAIHLKKIALDVLYTPVTTGASANIILEYSQDPLNVSQPTNWQQLTVSIPATTEVDVYAAGGTGMGTGSGTPIVIPTTGTSTGSVPYTPHIAPDTDLIANWVRVKALENNANSSFGTLWVGLSMQGE